MSGWSPLFSSMYTGSMRGKLYEQAVWTFMVVNKDRFGVVDFSVAYIAESTGVDPATVRAVIDRFCLPDPDSRSQIAEGRRLEALADRGFGWRVVNHDTYRERARRQLYDAQRTASGEDAKRKAAQRATRQESEESHDVPPVPPSPTKSRSHTHTHTQTQTQEQTQSELDTSSGSDTSVAAPRAARRTPKGWKRLPPEWKLSDELLAWAAEHAPEVDVLGEVAAIRDYEFTKLHTDADATVRTWLRTEQKRIDARKRMNGGRQAPESKFAAAKRRLREATE
jgi:hypothetical protein